MGQPATKQIEDWDISAEDALRTSILSTDVSRGQDVAKWNLNQYKQASTSFAVVESNPYDVMPPADSEVPVLDVVSEALSATIVAIYSPDDDYAKSLIDELSCHHPNLEFVRVSELNSDKLFDPNTKPSALFINMSDEDESPLLDLLLDQSDEIESLFLCDTSLSKGCYGKIEKFMKENNLLK